MPRKPSLAAGYMMELIEYGGQMVPRGYVYQLLLDVAKSWNYPKPRMLADRWMQGYELRRQIMERGKLAAVEADLGEVTST
jgi:hypothetical protein